MRPMASFNPVSYASRSFNRVSVRPALVLALCLAALLICAGCGSDGGDSDENDISDVMADDSSGDSRMDSRDDTDILPSDTSDTSPDSEQDAESDMEDMQDTGADTDPDSEDMVEMTDGTDMSDDQDMAPFEPGTWVDDCLSQFQSAGFDERLLTFNGPELRVGFIRDVDPDAFGTSGTTVFRAVRFALETADVQLCLDSNLEYTVSHHNFDDVFTATHDGVRYELTMHTEDYGAAWEDQLTLRDAMTDAILEGPITLTFEQCTPLTQNGICKLGRRD